MAAHHELILCNRLLTPNGYITKECGYHRNGCIIMHLYYSPEQNLLYVGRTFASLTSITYDVFVFLYESQIVKLRMTTSTIKKCTQMLTQPHNHSKFKFYFYYNIF